MSNSNAVPLLKEANSAVSLWGLAEKPGCPNSVQRLDEVRELEEQVGQAVEASCREIELRITQFFNRARVLLPEYVERVLAGQTSFNRQAVLAEVVREKALRSLLDDLKDQIQHQIIKVFGVASMEVPGMDVGWENALNGVFLVAQEQRQRQITISIMRVMEEAANLAWSHAASKAVPASLDMLFPDCPGGRLFFRAAGMGTARETANAGIQLRQGLAGTLDNIEFRIIQIMRRKTASVFYAILDTRE